MSGHQANGPRTAIDKLVFYLGAAGMLALFALVIYGVAMRYIFNRPPLHCQDQATCYCRTFGLCDLECEENGKCPSQYYSPMSLPTR